MVTGVQTCALPILFIIAALWTRVGTRTRSVLRGGSVSFFGRRLPIMSMVTGVLMVAVGIVFWMTNGLVSAPSLVPTTTLAHAQEWVSSWSSTTTDIIVVCVLAVLAIALWFRHERRRARRAAAADQAAASDRGTAASGQGGVASDQGGTASAEESAKPTQTPGTRH